MFDKDVPFGEACRNLACERPEATAVICGSSVLSWRELHARTNRVAHALRDSGVRIGDTVLIALPNGTDFVEACIAAWKVGAVPHPLSYKLTDFELQHLMEESNPAAVFADRDIGPGRRRVSVTALLNASQDETDPPEAVSPAWLVSASSGSTGHVKLIANAQPGTTSQWRAQAFHISEHDMVLITNPLYHGSGFVCAFAALFCGATVVLLGKFNEEHTLATIERYRITWTLLVPTMMNRIWRLPADVKAKYDPSSLRTVWHNGAPCPSWLKAAWIQWLGPDVIWEVYSATDGSATTVISGSEWLEHPGSVGRVVDGEISIRAEDGMCVPPRTVGEVCMRRSEGQSIVYRYVGTDRRRLVNGNWEATGDMGWMDEQGYLYLVDRRTDMILIGGANVYPAEIEAALEQHGAVVSSAVIGLPDDDLGNRIHAIVQVRSEVRSDELLQHLRQRLTPNKLPRSFEYVQESLRDDAGKLRRYQLRQSRMPARAQSAR